MLVALFFCVLLAAIALGGKPGRLASTQPRLPAIFVGAVVLQTLAYFLAPLPPLHRLLPTAYVISAWLLVVFVWLNRALPGAPLLLTGLVLNATAITLGGGAMPVSLDALAIARPSDLAANSLHVVGDGQWFTPLGDVLPLPLTRSVYSVGDIAVALGIARFIFVTTRTQARSVEVR